MESNPLLEADHVVLSGLKRTYPNLLIERNRDNCSSSALKRMTKSLRDCLMLWALTALDMGPIAVGGAGERPGPMAGCGSSFRGAPPEQPSPEVLFLFGLSQVSDDRDMVCLDDRHVLQYLLAKATGDSDLLIHQLIEHRHSQETT